jgi:hypothetical protein
MNTTADREFVCLDATVSNAVWKKTTTDQYIYPAGTSNPSSPTPSDGDIYYNTSLHMWMFYDGSRSKWLSQEIDSFKFGKGGNLPAGAYFRGIDNLTFSSTIGFVAPRNGTIVALTYSRDDTDSATFEVVKGGSSLSTVASTAVKGKDITLNNDFAVDDVLAVRNQSGGNTMSNASGWVQVRWRV